MALALGKHQKGPYINPRHSPHLGTGIFVKVKYPIEEDCDQNNLNHKCQQRVFAEPRINSMLSLNCVFATNERATAFVSSCMSNVITLPPSARPSARQSAEYPRYVPISSTVFGRIMCDNMLRTRP